MELLIKRWYACGVLNRYGILDAGYGILDAGYGILDTGFWILDAESIVILSVSRTAVIPNPLDYLWNYAD